MENSLKETIIQLRHERINQNLTYDEISERTGLSRSTIYRFFSEDLEHLHPRQYTIRVLKGILIDNSCDNTAIISLQEQLTIKDRQIERLTFILENLLTKPW